MRLPSSLQTNQEVSCALCVLERLAQLVQSTEAKIKICNHFRTGGPVFVVAGLPGGNGDVEEHKRSAEDDRDDLVVHAPECIVFLVDLE